LTGQGNPKNIVSTVSAEHKNSVISLHWARSFRRQSTANRRL